MSTEANKQVVIDFFAALSRGDNEAGFQLLADDMTWTVIGDTPVSGTYRGLKAIQEDFLGKVFQQIDPEAGIGMEMVELIAEDDKVVARIKGTVTGKYGPYNNTYCHVFTVRDGKIVENIEHLDTALIETALYGKKLAA